MGNVAKPYIGPFVRNVQKKLPVIAKDGSLAYEATIHIDTYGEKDHEQVVVDWTVLEALIDELVAVRRAQINHTLVYAKKEEPTSPSVSPTTGLAGI